MHTSRCAHRFTDLGSNTVPRAYKGWAIIKGWPRMDTALFGVKARCKAAGRRLPYGSCIFRWYDEDSPDPRMLACGVNPQLWWQLFSSSREHFWSGGFKFLPVLLIRLLTFFYAFQGLSFSRAIADTMLAYFDALCESSEALFRTPILRIIVSWVLGKRKGAKCLDSGRTPKNSVERSVLNGLIHYPKRSVFVTRRRQINYLVHTACANRWRKFHESRICCIDYWGTRTQLSDRDPGQWETSKITLCTSPTQ